MCGKQIFLYIATLGRYSALLNLIMHTINKKDQLIAEIMHKIDSRKEYYQVSDLEIIGLKLSILDAAENYSSYDDFKNYLNEISEDNLFLKSLI